MIQESNDLLEENGESFTLPEDTFQGYEFNYFRFYEGENPTVCQYIEGKGKSKLAWESFSIFLSDGINTAARFIRE